MNETLRDVIFCISFYTGLIIILVLFIANFHQLGNVDKNSRTSCTNIRKFYKDNIIFDKFYIACDEGFTGNITANQYTSIEEGENYTIMFTNGGRIYSLEKR